MIEKNQAKQIINNIFTLRRSNAIQTAKNNLNKALENKKLNTSFYKIRTLQFDLSKLDEKSDQAKQLTKQIEEEKANFKQILKELKLNYSDFLPKFKCKKCGDKGFVNGKPCSCFKAEQNRVYLLNSGINKEKLPSFENVDFGVFGKTENTNKKLYEIAKEFVDKFYETKKQNLIIVGNAGVGKTYLTECMLNEAIKNNIYSVYVTAFNLNQEFLKYHIAKIEDKSEILAPYLTCDLLIIDDLGSENKLNNVTVEYLYVVLDERARKNLKTVITTNLSPEQIQNHYEERVFSRMFNKQIGVVVNMQGDDLRFKKQTKK